MKQILVTYYSRSGNKEKGVQVLAEELMRLIQAKRILDLQVVIRKVTDVSLQDIVDASGVAIGSPNYFSYMAEQVTILFDELWAWRDEVAGKPTMGFVSHGVGGKAMNSLSDVTKHFKWKPTQGKLRFVFGIEEAPNEKAKETIHAASQMFLAEVTICGV